jgi:hypothetical protein
VVRISAEERAALVDSFGPVYLPSDQPIGQPAFEANENDIPFEAIHSMRVGVSRIMVELINEIMLFKSSHLQSIERGTIDDLLTVRHGNIRTAIYESIRRAIRHYPANAMHGFLAGVHGALSVVASEIIEHGSIFGLPLVYGPVQDDNDIHRLIGHQVYLVRLVYSVWAYGLPDSSPYAAANQQSFGAVAPSQETLGNDEVLLTVDDNVIAMGTAIDPQRLPTSASQERNGEGVPFDLNLMSVFQVVGTSHMEPFELFQFFPASTTAGLLRPSRIQQPQQPRQVQPTVDPSWCPRLAEKTQHRQRTR